MHSKTRKTLCAIALLGSHLLPGSFAQAESPADWPDWLKQEMKKEANVADTSPFSLAEAGVSGKISGVIDDAPIKDDNSWYFSAKLGAAGIVECWLFTEERDPASLTTNLGRYVIDVSNSESEQSPSKQVYGLDAGHIDGNPYFAVDWLYSVGAPPNARIGLSKLRTALVDGYTVACSHNRLGYRETFNDVFQRLVASLIVKNSAIAPYYEEIYITSIAGRNVGFSRETYTLDGDGDTRIVSVESMLVPVDASSLITSDTWRTSYSTPSGEMINGYVASVENGQLVRDIALNSKDGEWHVSGSLMDKPIEGTISSEQVPLSSLGFNLALQGLIQDSSRNKFDYYSWIPSADPVNFVLSTFETGKDRRTGTLTTGPLVFSIQLNEDGVPKALQTNIGGVDMVMNHAWHSADLKQRK